MRDKKHSTASESIDSRLSTSHRWNDMLSENTAEGYVSASLACHTDREMRESIYVREASKVFILTDDNVAPFWLPEVTHWLHCNAAVDIIIKAGEQHKNLQTVQRIWKTLMKHHADRNTLLVNLGGGVVTDLGGFAASTYKRGIKFVNIPTTLLAMVDAAIGGKTGIDFGGGKNQIGTFTEAEEVLIKPVFLETLPKRELLSGMAEMLKYGFIANNKLLEISLENYQQFILRCGEIKREIVEQDPREKGLRKILNFGHTLGHAIESYCLTTENPLLHGEAVALGMGAALWLSVKLCALDEKVLQDYEKQLPVLLSEAEVNLTEAHVEPILDYLVLDKKNIGEKPQFILLEAVGKPVRDVEVESELVKQSLVYVINKVSPK